MQRGLFEWWGDRPRSLKTSYFGGKELGGFFSLAVVFPSFDPMCRGLCSTDASILSSGSILAKNNHSGIVSLWLGPEFLAAFLSHLDKLRFGWVELCLLPWLMSFLPMLVNVGLIWGSCSELALVLAGQGHWSSPRPSTNHLYRNLLPAALQLTQVLPAFEIKVLFPVVHTPGGYSKPLPPRPGGSKEAVVASVGYCCDTRDASVLTPTLTAAAILYFRALLLLETGWAEILWMDLLMCQTMDAKSLYLSCVQC